MFRSNHFSWGSIWNGVRFWLGFYWHFHGGRGFNQDWGSNRADSNRADTVHFIRLHNNTLAQCSTGIFFLQFGKTLSSMVSLHCNAENILWEFLLQFALESFHFVIVFTTDNSAQCMKLDSKYDNLTLQLELHYIAHWSKRYPKKSDSFLHNFWCYKLNSLVLQVLILKIRFWVIGTNKTKSW